MAKWLKMKGWDRYYYFPLFEKIHPKIARYHYRKYYAPLLNDFDGKTTLELGGGTGLLSERIREKFGTTPTIVDNSLAAYEHFKNNGNSGKYVIEDIFNFSTNKKFDLVFSDGFLEHFPPSKQRELVKIHASHCKKGGDVIIAIPRSFLLSRKIFSRICVKEYKIPADQLIKMMREEGLKPIKKVSNRRYIGVLAKKQ